MLLLRLTLISLVPAYILLGLLAYDRWVLRHRPPTGREQGL